MSCTNVQLGSFLHIRQFLEQIFGDPLELGFDYLTILYKYPYQSLPILSLISQENNTGKSTFLKPLKNVFGHNMTFNSMSDIRSTFNSDWASKLIIGIEESSDSNRKEDSEKIKNLSTAMTFKLEAKGQDRFEIEFFGKIILCSNNERNFIFMDQAEIRYWVRKIPTIPKHSLDPDLLNKMIQEIPGFRFLPTFPGNLCTTKNTHVVYGRTNHDARTEKDQGSLSKPCGKGDNPDRDHGQYGYQ